MLTNVGNRLFLSGEEDEKPESTRRSGSPLKVNQVWSTSVSASGMVERFNQTCKNMLSHIIQQHQRQWHKYLPLAVWALREVLNATTGTSPYMLVYGRTPRGPLAVLKETWTGERDVPVSLGKSVEAYMEELRDKLETAANFANDCYCHRRRIGVLCLDMRHLRCQG